MVDHRLDGGSNSPIHSSRRENLRTDEPRIGMGEKEITGEEGHREVSECRCPSFGFCEVRKTQVNVLLWKKCKEGHFERVSQLIEGAKRALENPRPQVSSPPKTPILKEKVSNVGTEIKEIVEKEIDRKLTCADCLGFLASLDYQRTHNHWKIVEHLSSQFPWPIAWRERNPKRRDVISNLISSVVPIPPPQFELAPNFKETKVLQFVIPYVDSEARQDELRWCVRSIETFCQEPFLITLIGDRPEWYRGHHIQKERLQESEFRSFRDSFSKVDLIRTSDEILDEVMWVMDDTYFNKPFTRVDFSQGRLNHRDIESIQSKEYKRLMKSTMFVLDNAGLTQFDFTSHLPQLIRKDRWIEMCERFDMPNQIFIWENLYGNLFASNPQSYQGFVTRINKSVPDVTQKYDLDSPFVINNSHEGWNNSLRKWLKKKFPTPAKIES